ncbi:MAG: cobalt transporter, partial [Clostridiales bacterium]|nr:cobalt transporter [Clostridiales bacterium]
DHGHHHHDHEHHHHDHCHEGCGHDCQGCANVDPRQELIALMKYMVGHNTAHANELAQLAGKLKDMGENMAYDQVMQAVSDFEKGNMRLSTVLAALNV